MFFRQIADPKLAQYAYLIGCQKTGEAVIIDPERDIDRYIEFARAEGLEITAVTETHIHADFLSGAREFAERGVRVYLTDEGGPGWRYEWPTLGRRDGSPYDVVLLKDGDTIKVGNIELQAVHTPGHTPEHLSFLVTDHGGGATTPMGIASGDFVFVGDLGRPDLLEQAAGLHGVQEPSARTLYQSLPRFTELEGHLQVWPAHGAGSTCGKALGAVPVTTVGYEKRYNASLGAAASGEDAFVRAILDGQPEPQMYFARMKRDNRDGAPVLGELPNPPELSAHDLTRLTTDGETLVIDARLDRSAFMRRHLARSLYAPLNKSFNTVVGSLVMDETQPIALIIEDASRVEEAVRDLIRLGYDRVIGFATAETLEAALAAGAPAGQIEEIGFAEMAQRRQRGGVVVDARFASEYAAGHVPGAISASYTRLPQYLGERIPAGGTLLVHCASGARSAAAAAYLAREGRDVVYVGGNFAEWREIGEVETGAPAPVAA